MLLYLPFQLQFHIIAQTFFFILILSFSWLFEYIFCPNTLFFATHDQILMALLKLHLMKLKSITFKKYIYFTALEGFMRRPRKKVKLWSYLIVTSEIPLCGMSPVLELLRRWWSWKNTYAGVKFRNLIKILILFLEFFCWYSKIWFVFLHCVWITRYIFAVLFLSLFKGTFVEKAVFNDENDCANPVLLSNVKCYLCIMFT